MNYVAHKLTKDNIYDVCVAANPTMIHLLAGINPASMGKAPYKPAFQGALSLKGIDLGLPVSPFCNVYSPAVSSFIGGDITGDFSLRPGGSGEKTLY